MGLSIQQQSFIANYISNGLRDGGAAARSAGYARNGSRVRAHRLLRMPAIQQAIQTEQERLQQENQFTVDKAVALLFEAHSKAATATEEIAAIREIGKLLGLYAPQKKEETVVNTQTAHQLEQMSDEELMQIITKPEPSATIL